jgi:hypothetical protein
MQFEEASPNHLFARTAMPSVRLKRLRPAAQRERYQSK